MEFESFPHAAYFVEKFPASVRKFFIVNAYGQRQYQRSRRDSQGGQKAQGLLEFGGCFFVCGTGRQPIQRDKTINDNYYLLTLVAIAKEIRQRGLPPECS